MQTTYGLDAVSLPSEPPAESAPAKTGAAPSGESRTVLFVDDETQVRRAFKRAMSERGFDVHLASSSFEATKMLQKHFYAVVVSDYRMPGRDGIAFAEWVQRHDPATTFIIVSGVSNFDTSTTGAEDDAIVAKMTKPWDDDAMAGAIERAIEVSQKRSQQV